MNRRRKKSCLRHWRYKSQHFIKLGISLRFLLDTLLPIKNGNVRIVSFYLKLQRICGGFEADSSKDYKIVFQKLFKHFRNDA